MKITIEKKQKANIITKSIGLSKTDKNQKKKNLLSCRNLYLHHTRDKFYGKNHQPLAPEKEKMRITGSRGARQSTRSLK